MSTQPLDPPREVWETVTYEEDPFGLGDVDETKLQMVSKDFLPKPEDLVFTDTKKKVTISLDQNNINFFKGEAARLKIPYQRMIRNLLIEYQHHHERRTGA